MKTEIWNLTAVDLARMIAQGGVSAVEAVEAYLARIKAVNPAVNAVVNVLADGALEAAREVDRKRRAGEVLGPLAGVPFSAKENIDVAGSATTHGVPVLRQAVAPLDAPIVERLRRAGAIPICRTNLPDLSMRFHTASQLYGDTINPWDPTRTPGGSSGGEGVALATGMSALGLGNDAGGSVRVPALFSGVAGLKPSFGRFPGDRSVGPRDLTLASQWIPVDGVLARSVEDLDAAFRLLAGPDPRDPRAVPAPLAGEPRPLRAGIAADPGGQGVHLDARAAVERAAAALEEAGYTVEPVEVPRLEDALDAYLKMIMTEFHQSWPMLQRILPASGRRYIELSMAKQGPVGLAEYTRLAAVHLSIQRDWAQLLERYPVLVGPVFTEQPPDPGFDVRGPEEQAILSRALRLCTASSFVGVPAVAVPTGLANGLPQGVQVVASFYREDLCLSAAAVIEAHCGRLAPIDPRGTPEAVPVASEMP
jgi:amidase